MEASDTLMCPRTAALLPARSDRSAGSRRPGSTPVGGTAALLLIGISLLLNAGSARDAAAVVRNAQIVVREGQPLGYSTVTSLNTPFTDGFGRVTFVAGLADGERAIWWDAGPIFYSGEANPEILIGGESSMGATDRGRFVYSPAIDGHDGVYTDHGSLLKEGDPFPPVPGTYSSFNSRPTMLPNGEMYWVAGMAQTPGGPTVNRCLVRAPDNGNPSAITWVLGGGDVIGGLTVRTTSSNLDFSISDNGAHHLHILDMDATPNEYLYRDGSFVAAEGGGAGDGTHWADFVQGCINNSGDYIFCGTTDGDPSHDWFIAWNGVIGIREGDSLVGVPLPAGSTVSAVSMNNSGKAAFIWTGSGGAWLFYGTGQYLQVSYLSLAVGDSLQTNGGGPADYAVTGIIASPPNGPGLDISDDGRVFVRVNLKAPQGGEFQAVIGLRGDITDVAQFPASGSSKQSRSLECRPTPFRDSADLLFDNGESGPARLTVCDPAGRVVRLLTREDASSGLRRVLWDGRDDSGRPVPAGVYFVVLEGKNGRLQDRVVRVR